MRNGNRKTTTKRNKIETVKQYQQNKSETDWAPWQPGTCEVGRLVRRAGGPSRKMLKEEVERRREPGALG